MRTLSLTPVVSHKRDIGVRFEKRRDALMKALPAAPQERPVPKKHDVPAEFIPAGDVFYG
jgi:hypothetical protein